MSAATQHWILHRDADEHSSAGARTLVSIHRTRQRPTCALALSGFTPAPGQARVYRWSSANLGAVVPQPGQPVRASGTSLALPGEPIAPVAIPGA